MSTTDKDIRLFNNLSQEQFKSAMFVFEQIAEQKIKRALESGSFDNLKGQGSPLKLGDDSLVPKELRMGFRILKNAGVSPREVQVLNEINKLKQELKLTQDKYDKQLLVHQISILRTNYFSKAIVSSGSRLSK